MSLNVGNISARFGLDPAEFLEKMRGVSGATKFFSDEMKRSMKDSSREGAESFRLIDEALGIRVSRPLTRILTQEFPALATGLQSILGASVFGALASVGVEAFDKVAKSVEKAMHAQEEWKASIAKTEATIESVADSYARKIAEANGLDPMMKRAMAGADEAKNAFDKVAAAIDEENKKALEAAGTWTQFKAAIGDTWHEIFTSNAGLDTEKLQGQLGTLKTEIQEAFRLDALHGTHEAMQVFQRDLDLSTQKLQELVAQRDKEAAAAAQPPDATLWMRGKQTAKPEQKVTPEQIAAVQQWVNLLEHAKEIEQDREKLEKADAGAAARAQALRDEAVAQEKLSALYREMGSSLARLQPETDPLKKLNAEIDGFEYKAEAAFESLRQSSASALSMKAATAELDRYEEKLEALRVKGRRDLELTAATANLPAKIAPTGQAPVFAPPTAMPTLGAGGLAGAKLDTFAKDQTAQLKMAAQAYEAGMTAQEKYRLGAQELDLLVKENLIDDTARAAAMTQLDEQLVKAASSTHKLQEEMQKMLERSDSAAAGVKAWALQLQIAGAETGKFTYDVLTASTKGAEEDATNTLFAILEEQRGGHLKLIHDLEAMWSGYFKNLATMGMKAGMDRALAPLGKAITGGMSGKQQQTDPLAGTAQKGVGGVLGQLFGAAKPGANGAAALTSAGTMLHTAATALMSAATALRASAAGGVGGGASASGDGSLFAAPANDILGSIPFFSGGGDATPGSSFISGEAGAEKVDLDRSGGAHITPLGVSQASGDTHNHFDMRGSIVSDDLMRRTEAASAIKASEGRMLSAMPAMQREINLRRRT
jgi:hypothetical protein